ncbi:MAG: metalloregulator ArsR/SmtB family transcription factor [Devosia sp.]|jgi:ubiquinone/menaquinone biosynthesis C-methylase UbiE/DNA-binding transcriptional ArsR family regulator|uniref:metalloregulator ArsR/SmtB family transcription factor n=1 Tax=unclassified Devosia TaxID=196773 RepID=UPI0019F2435E|nr:MULTISPECIES: metalloregulator ArsR/SmtB family transcription factor [unclassified Devosia]MBF0679400.1 metalloregulator ArsR/SmtB family transcription factor [Devosia sp.]WEJ34688.1 metalloregulator ArsR/SmtB family transcription factor [Devosia sp. SD17-2]
MSDLNDLVGVLRAAGEGTRLRLLALLADGDHSVKDLTEILDQSQPRVSRHLKLLADAGLVQRHAEGAWAYYGLAPSGDGAELARWLVARLSPDDAERLSDKARQDAIFSAQQARAGAYFAKVADSWDLQKTLHVPEAAVEAAMLEALDGRTADLLVDLGTGTGRMLEVLAPRFRRGIGIDSSREMLAVARARLASSGLAQAQVRLGDIAALDPAIGPADVITIHQVLHYFDDPGRMLAQARRLLSPGGDILIVDFAPHDLEFLRTEHAHRRLGLSGEQMNAWAEAADLDVRAVREFPSNTSDRGLTVCLWHLSDRK